MLKINDRVLVAFFSVVLVLIPQGCGSSKDVKRPVSVPQVQIVPSPTAIPFPIPSPTISPLVTPSPKPSPPVIARIRANQVSGNITVASGTNITLSWDSLGASYCYVSPAPFPMLAGDWNGDGITSIGVFDLEGRQFYLRNSNSTGNADYPPIRYGPKDTRWVPLLGDWDANGTTTLGMMNQWNRFFLKNDLGAGVADILLSFGPKDAGFLPLAGDWNGDGVESIGLYDPFSGAVYLRNTNTSGFADTTFQFIIPNAGVLPLAGDWNGDGITSLGLYDPVSGTFHLKNNNSAGPADLVFHYKPTLDSWLPIAGDWNGDGKSTIGLCSPTTATFYLRNANNSGAPDLTFAFGFPQPGFTGLSGIMDSGVLAASITYRVTCMGLGGISVDAVKVTVLP